ncbi:uncharacterized protein LOC141907549 [Tubulanus polymorphus]|uniref:uncharacterized protein LOC141907549 n=1 Tax=Tubulanus polymorphus TaxID=672921 RepID=UPI003DA2BA5E
MFTKLALGLLLAHGVFGCTIITNNLLGRLRENTDPNGESLYALDGNQVGIEHFTAPGQEHLFSVHSTGVNGMRGVVVKVDSPRPECGRVVPTAENSEALADCPGGISSTGEPKRRFLFSVKAPQCGCITIRAMVIGMDRHVYGEDAARLNGKLTKTICLQKKQIDNNIPSGNVIIEPIPTEPVIIPISLPEENNVDSEETLKPDLETVLDEIEKNEEKTTPVSPIAGPNRHSICIRYDRATKHHRVHRRPVRLVPRGRRVDVMRRRSKRHGRRGRFAQSRQQTASVTGSVNFGWRFRRSLVRECCKFEGIPFTRCYNSMIADRNANTKEPDVIHEQEIEPPVEQETPIIEEDDQSDEVADLEDDPDYIPTPEEEESAYDDEEEYEEDELIDSDEVKDLVADNQAAETDTELQVESDDATDCALHGRRGRGKCLMRECCAKGKELGRSHRGRLWKRCVAGSKATIFRQATTRRQKHRCRVVFRHCCIAAGRRSIAEEATAQVAIKEAKVIETENKIASSEEQETSVSSDSDETEGRLGEQCCAAGARVASPRNAIRCRQFSQQLIREMNLRAFFARKCTAKFLRCCLIYTPQQTGN